MHSTGWFFLSDFIPRVIPTVTLSLFMAPNAKDETMGQEDPEATTGEDEQDDPDSQLDKSTATRVVGAVTNLMKHLLPFDGARPSQASLQPFHPDTGAASSQTRV